MQKKILAAAIGGMLIAPAAFAQVSISGRLSVGLEIYELDDGTRTPYNAEQRVSDQSSSLIFTGSEDLGGGLEAWFKIDNRFSFPDTSFSSSGNTQLGFRGDWGQLAIGRSDLHYNELNAFETTRSGSLQSWLAPGLFSQVAGVPIANTTRTPNVIMWDGAFGDGVTARLAYSTSPFGPEGSGVSGDGGEGDGVNAALRWSGGPLSVGASVWSAEAEAAVSDLEQDSTRVWAGYEFGNITVAFGYDQSSIKSTALTGGDEAERTAFLIPVKVALSPADTLTVSFATADDIELGGADLPETSANAFKIGWDHALSKRTFVGVHYVSLENDADVAYNLFALGASGATAAADGEDATQLYFGVAHFY